MPLTRTAALRRPARARLRGLRAAHGRGFDEAAAVAASLHPGRRAERGQALVLVALFLSAMLAFAALAIDVGRFMAERRFLQNAADAAALAAVNTIVRGGSIIDAEAAARASLTLNFAGDPTGSAPSQPSLIPVYAAGHAGEGAPLVDGIVVTSSDARVAIRTPVNYTFGRVVGALDQQVGARARAGYTGKLLPIAVQNYMNPTATGGVAPCIDLLGQFTDVFATELTACLGDVVVNVLRLLPSTQGGFNPAFPVDPVTNPVCNPTYQGPDVPILGQGAQPPGGSDFRGFVALDIRNFAAEGSQLYFNGVTSTMVENQLKGIEAAYITAGGYPGPDFPVVVTPPDPNLQVAAMSGNATGVALEEMARRYVPGDTILVSVYSGAVMRIPDFAITAPANVTVPSTGVTLNLGTIKVSRNQSFSGQVTLSTLADTLDPNHPVNLGKILGLDSLSYIPNPVTPSLGSGTSVIMQNLTTLAATPGIYTMWIRGEAGSPYLTTKYVPFPLQVGVVTRDFALTSDTEAEVATNVGDSVSFLLTLQNSPNRNTNFGGTVALSVDPGAVPAGQASLSSASVIPSRDGRTTTLTVNTTGMAPGQHRIVVRATGMNGDLIPRRVTHLLPLTLNVATGGASNVDYVDIVGFAVMRVAQNDGNTVWACAVTAVYPDMNDPALNIGREARLRPW